MAKTIDKAIDKMVVKTMSQDKTTRYIRITAARKLATEGMNECVEIKDEREDRWLTQVAKMKALQLTEADQTWKDAAARHARTMKNLDLQENSFLIKKL